MNNLIIISIIALLFLTTGMFCFISEQSSMIFMRDRCMNNEAKIDESWTNLYVAKENLMNYADKHFNNANLKVLGLVENGNTVVIERTFGEKTDYVAVENLDNKDMDVSIYEYNRQDGKEVAMRIKEKEKVPENIREGYYKVLQTPLFDLFKEDVRFVAKQLAEDRLFTEEIAYMIVKSIENYAVEQEMCNKGELKKIFEEAEKEFWNKKFMIVRNNKANFEKVLNVLTEYENVSWDPGYYFMENDVKQILESGKQGVDFFIDGYKRKLKVSYGRNKDGIRVELLKKKRNLHTIDQNYDPIEQFTWKSDDLKPEQRLKQFLRRNKINEMGLYENYKLEKKLTKRIENKLLSKKNFEDALKFLTELKNFDFYEVNKGFESRFKFDYSMLNLDEIELKSVLHGNYTVRVKRKETGEILIIIPEKDRYVTYKSKKDKYKIEKLLSHYILENEKTKSSAKKEENDDDDEFDLKLNISNMFDKDQNLTEKVFEKEDMLQDDEILDKIAMERRKLASDRAENPANLFFDLPSKVLATLSEFKVRDEKGNYIPLENFADYKDKETNEIMNNKFIIENPKDRKYDMIIVDPIDDGVKILIGNKSDGFDPSNFCVINDKSQIPTLKKMINTFCEYISKDAELKMKEEFQKIKDLESDVWKVLSKFDLKFNDKSHADVNVMKKWKNGIQNSGNFTQSYMFFIKSQKIPKYYGIEVSLFDDFVRIGVLNTDKVYECVDLNVDDSVWREDKLGELENFLNKYCGFRKVEDNPANLFSDIQSKIYATLSEFKLKDARTEKSISFSNVPDYKAKENKFYIENAKKAQYDRIIVKPMEKGVKILIGTDGDNIDKYCLIDDESQLQTMKLLFNNFCELKSKRAEVEQVEKFQKITNLQLEVLKLLSYYEVKSNNKSLSLIDVYNQKYNMLVSGTDHSFPIENPKMPNFTTIKVSLVNDSVRIGTGNVYLDLKVDDREEENNLIELQKFLDKYCNSNKVKRANNLQTEILTKLSKYNVGDAVKGQKCSSIAEENEKKFPGINLTSTPTTSYLFHIIEPNNPDYDALKLESNEDGVKISLRNSTYGKFDLNRTVNDPKDLNAIDDWFDQYCG